MTAENRKAFQQHVDFGLSKLAQFPGLPDTVTNIIRQHHERIDGSGYPAQLKGNQLSLLSRILMAVDEYERLINAPDIRQNLSPTEALSKLYLTGKSTFSDEVVVALIQTLRVYPPGTVVELTDKSIGLVISINLHARMHPLVIMYDPTVDQENPNIANLSHDTNRSIARSITRNELSQPYTVDGVFHQLLHGSLGGTTGGVEGDLALQSAPVLCQRPCRPSTSCSSSPHSLS